MSGDPSDDKLAEIADFSLFQHEEDVLAESQDMLAKLGSVSDGVKALADNYRQSYKEQQRLVRISDRLQLQLHQANAKLAEQAAELKALNRSLEKEITARTKLSKEMEALANVDSLTEAFTRRHFIELVERELKRIERKPAPMALLLADLDDFKSINDRFGHHMGDRALKLFGAECRKHLRDSDIFGRLGGEEFAIALPDTEIDPASQVAERIREALIQSGEADQDLAIRMTISIGVTAFHPGDRLERALRRADEALYRAKADGRNRVVTTPVP